MNRLLNGEIAVGAPGSPARLAAARTKGPLMYEINEGKQLFSIHSSDKFYVAESNYHFDNEEQPGYRERADADSRHIVLCWNALEGWDVNFIPEFLAAARKMVRSSLTPVEWQELSKLLAKAEGRV